MFFMFFRGGYFRHRSCLDIDIKVVKVLYRDAKRVKMKALFVRQTDGASLGFSPERVEIQRSDFKNWKMVGHEGNAPSSTS